MQQQQVAAALPAMVLCVTLHAACHDCRKDHSVHTSIAVEDGEGSQRSGRV